MRITAITRYKHGDLFALLKKVGWNQSDLARNSGLSNHIIGRICNLLSRPSVTQANAIQKAFGEIGEYFDVLECWPDTFSGMKKPLCRIQTEEVDLGFLLDHQQQLLLGDTTEIDLDGLKIVMEEALKSVSERERCVLRLRAEGLSLSEVGEKLKICPERVRQLEAKGLRKMRHPQRANKLQEFLPR